MVVDYPHGIIEFDALKLQVGDKKLVARDVVAERRALFITGTHIFKHGVGGGDVGVHHLAEVGEAVKIEVETGESEAQVVTLQVSGEPCGSAFQLGHADGVRHGATCVDRLRKGYPGRCGEMRNRSALVSGEIAFRGESVAIIAQGDRGRYVGQTP